MHLIPYLTNFKAVLFLQLYAESGCSRTLRCLINGGVKISGGGGGGGWKISNKRGGQNKWGEGVLKTANYVVRNSIPICHVRNRFKQ